MTKLISKTVENTSLSGIRLVANFIKKPIEDVIELTVGEIDLPTPEATKKAGISAIEQDKTKYTDNRGMLPLRKVISQYMKGFYDTQYNPDNEIIVTVGASQGIDLTIRGLVNAGDEVIIVSPGYTAYMQAITLAGAKPIVVDTRESNFRLQPEQLNAAITDKTKLVILNYPNNPSGVVLNTAELTALSHVIKQHDLYVLTDDVYNRLVYDQDYAPSIASVPGMKERTIVLNGLSKSHSMTGWRIGYLLGPEKLIEEIFKIHQANVGCVSSIAQEAAMVALTSDKDNPKHLVTIFRERRDYIMARLDEMGLDYIKPEGAFYVFVNIEKFKLSSLNFVKYLIESVDLAVVHGSAFTDFGEGYIRISYAMDIPTLQEAMNRLQAAIEILNNRVD
ncbi:pyridoxal phosphate-dependent aminotransferase [Leuconostoc miyukkimchii]|uniref:pyridoxal phosphate-dependent aminotransferase n=1 Tax=Leuconostoc miyukkimchii TaxID=910540 RepID=UPI001C7DCE99|nr:aminotransferase class I/II-fold pyridoxal phosphate-dependent enzyme [Leuconostoc miyukkimchii]